MKASNTQTDLMKTASNAVSKTEGWSAAKQSFAQRATTSGSAKIFNRKSSMSVPAPGNTTKKGPEKPDPDSYQGNGGFSAPLPKR